MDKLPALFRLILIFFFLVLQPASAQDADTSAPNILSFDFGPKAINTATSSQEITFTVHLTDDLSGVWHGGLFGGGTPCQAQFVSPSGNQQATVTFDSRSNLISGNELDGVYSNKMTLPRYSEQGTWKLSSILLVDDVNNQKGFSRADAIALGFPTEFQVGSAGDTTPPNILSFDFGSKAINTAASSQEITFTVHLTDDLSGVWHGGLFGGGTPCQAQFVSPSGNQQATVTFDSPNKLISGNELDGVYSNKMTLPRYSEQGTWKLGYILLIDDVGNQKQLSRADAVALGFPTEFRNSPISGGLSISGMKLSDVNSNGIKDAGESGVPDWTIELLQGGNTIETTATGNDGSYSFNYLGAGTYTVREVPQVGWTQTYPTGNVHTVALSDKISAGNDFGNHQLVNSDVTPPNLISFDFDPKTINTATSSQQISFTAHITDDLSGLSCREISDNVFMCGGGHASFRSPSGQQNAQVSFSPQDRVSGNDLDGVYSSKLTLPKYSEQGKWTLEHFSIQDSVGNSRELSRGEMASLGFPTDFRVESQGDTSPPNLVSFDFDPKTINTATSSQQISFTAHITDDLSGLSCREISDNVFMCGGGHASFRSPSGQQNAGVRFSSQDLVSGNDLDGVYSSKLTLPKYSEQGTWTLEHFSIQDSVGNSRELSSDEMAALGFPTEFINGQETEPLAPKASLTKSASSSVVSPGGTLTYTITYANLEDTALQEVVIAESYPSGATFLSASPAPDSGTDNRWTIGTLPGHASGTITIEVKAPEETKIKFDMVQSAKGVGFVSTYRNLNTGREPQTFTNQVSMTARGLTGVTAVSKVTISGEEGTKLALRESGSGTYAREEQLQYLRENRSIKDVSNLSVSYQAANFQLPGNRSIGHNSKWTEIEKAKNYITSESVEESYRYASKINRESLIALDRNGTRMAVDSQFEGMRHAGYLEASKPDAKGHISPLKELSSDYTGSFRVKEKLGTTFSNRSNAITTVKHYDQPHVTIYQRSEPDNTNENNLNYTISILNDGNRSLGPIYLMDLFPAGTRFFDASTRPSEELLPESEHANWTFTYLPMGQAVTVYLRLMRYVVLEVPVNRVYVNAGYDGNWIKINDSTVSNFNWLSSMPQGERQNTNPGGWNPPDWGFDQTEDICESCTYSPPAD